MLILIFGFVFIFIIFFIFYFYFFFASSLQEPFGKAMFSFSTISSSVKSVI